MAGTDALLRGLRRLQVSFTIVERLYGGQQAIRLHPGGELAAVDSCGTVRCEPALQAALQAPALAELRTHLDQSHCEAAVLELRRDGAVRIVTDGAALDFEHLGALCAHLTATDSQAP
ncbi:hypothetical protein J2T57_001723 [Natronocella acetinitrilica]|uniref:Uncharacterized protein n=1 Tax=Natronocella acetinitrilica TaxID=414046 RepID=A0AAE3G4J3_9GAMM|nr:hypothetical protein [Natronocella acetinitrilica]MCP1674621.1 hypothetical protein [Natronocella acetinitrilica]